MAHTWKPRLRTFALLLLMMIVAPQAHACADGPDTYSVRDVASSDTLNVRSGPGLKFGVVGTLPFNATGLNNLDQVPIFCSDPSGLNEFERKNFWTKISWKSGDKFVVGWVKSRFLTE